MDDRERERSEAMASSITLGGAASALLQALVGDPKHRASDEEALKELDRHGMVESWETGHRVTSRGEEYLKATKERE